MKKYFLLTFAVLFINGTFAQMNDYSMMGFKPKVMSTSAPDNVVEYLENKVSEILTNDGIVHTSGDFVIEVVINELNKTLTPTAPPRIQLQLEVTFKSIDKKQGVVFNSITLPASGMNTTEAAAYMSAIRSINFKTRNFLNFLDVSKSKLYEYYRLGYATQPEPEPEPAPAPAPAPMPELIPAPTPAHIKAGVELWDGVYAEYIKYEHKSSSTDIIIKFTNYNSQDSYVDLQYRTQMIIDTNGNNIEARNNASKGNFTLLQGVPLSVSFNFKGNVAPVAFYLSEASHDIRVKMNCR